MNTLNERIKKLRKGLDLTQQEFADRLGTTRNNIAGYEVGRRSPSEAVISLICKTFNGSETWLRTGEGEMFVQRTRDDELSAFMNELLSDETPDFRRRLITALSRLKPEQWDALEAVALELMKDPALSSSARVSTQPEKPLTRAEKVELYNQQLLFEEEREKQASSANESDAV